MELTRQIGGTSIAYEEHDFLPPWEDGETVVLLHGIAETRVTWNPWIPVLTSTLRVVRLDLPGFGASPVPRDDWDWSPGAYARVVRAFVDALNLPRFHLVGAKYGGKIALALAAELGDRLLSLTVFSAQPYALSGDSSAVVREAGVRGWAEQTQKMRLGSAASSAQISWWTDELMANADADAVYGCIRASETSDISADLSRIHAPTLVVTTAGSHLVDVDEVRRYRDAIPRARAVVLEGDGYHPVATEPVECAQMTVEHIQSARVSS